MKIYTKVVIGPDGDIVEQESYDYIGPVAHAFSGSAAGGKSKTESSSGNRWTMLMDELRYGQEKQRDPFVKENTLALNRPSFAGPDGQMYSTPEEASGMRGLKGLTDITDLFAETKRQYENDAIPMITNKMSAAGYGRTPNVGRAVARGWMDAILPVMQEGREAQRGFSNLQMGFGARRLGQASVVSPLTSSSRSSGSSWNLSHSGSFMGG